jgi:hypothetical protein
LGGLPKYEDCLAWFLSYTGLFQFTDPKDEEMISLKHQHTLRVVKEIGWLAKSEKLFGREIELAMILGLFHDIGRFSQFARYRTWSDFASENHAKLGVLELKEEGVLERFSQEEASLLIFSIVHDNRSRTPLRCTPQKRLFAALLRDADKLDIIQVVYKSYKKVTASESRPTLEVLIDSSEISPAIIESFKAHRPVTVQNIRTTTDLLAFYVSWVFDMNFDLALAAMASRGYPLKLKELMPCTCQVDQIFEVAEKYLKYRLRR